MTIQEQINEAINYEDFYKKYIRLKPKRGNQVQANCPFHDDKVASLSINLRTGQWQCFGCPDRKSGNVFTFCQEYLHLDPQAALKFLANETNIELPEKSNQLKESKQRWIPAETVNGYHKLLFKSPETLDFLTNKRGLSEETLKRYKIGWNGTRVSIPIREKRDHCINIRLYSSKAKSENKMLSYKVGYGEARLYPIKNIESNTLFFFEGEMDTLLANQLDYPAITATGGAGTWKEEWLPLFKGKTVYICYDVNDKNNTGQIAAKRIGTIIATVAKEVYNIILPLTEPVGADFTNYIVDYGHSKEDFDNLIKKAEIIVPKKILEKQIDETVYDVHLSQSSDKRYYQKKIRMNVLIAGKDLAPYYVPHKVTVSCKRMGSTKLCGMCSITAGGGNVQVEFSKEDYKILELIGCTDNFLKQKIREFANIPEHCGKYSCTIDKAMNIEEIHVIPELDFSTEDTEYVMRRCFYIGHGIKSNQTYTLEGLSVPDPKTQYATHLIKKAIPSQDNISSFQMTSELKKQLEIFQPAGKQNSGGKQSIKEKFEEIHDDLSYNITKIYQRNDYLTAIDLIYHSVLHFDFLDTLVYKGWCECLVLGDEGTGKTLTIKNIIKHYKAGEMATSGEATTPAGLIGGLQQNQNRWVLSWGKLALNDKRLYIIDEASGLSLETIGMLSGMRSSGVAELIKIQTERTNARTRLIWISNPRKDRKLNTFDFGVNAIKELIGKPEDIRRFDFAITVAENEISKDIINQAKHKTVEHKYTSELCNRLVVWAWSRQKKDIKFTPKANEKILEYAKEMGNKYVSSIPLVQISEQRIKLARLSVACACRMFSTEDGNKTGDGTKVIVKSEHIDFVYEFLNEIYSKTSLGYDVYSKNMKRELELTEEKSIYDKIAKTEHRKDIIDNLLGQRRITLSDIMDFTTFHRSEAKEFLSFLVRKKALKKNYSWYEKTPAFIVALKDWQKKIAEEEMF